MQRVQLNLVVDPLHEISVSYCLSYRPFIFFSKVSSASLIRQIGCFALPAVMGCTLISLLRRTTLTGLPQWIPIPGRVVSGTSFRAILQSIKIINQSQTTMDIMLTSSGLEESSSGQSHYLLNKYIYSSFSLLFPCTRYPLWDIQLVHWIPVRSD